MSLFRFASNKRKGFRADTRYFPFYYFPGQIFQLPHTNLQ